MPASLTAYPRIYPDSLFDLPNFMETNNAKIMSHSWELEETIFVKYLIETS